MWEKKAEVSVFMLHSGSFLVNMNYRGFVSSDLPRPSVIIEEAAAGQRPSGSSAAGENNCYFQINVSTTKKKWKKSTQPEINLSVNSAAY